MTPYQNSVALKSAKAASEAFEVMGKTTDKEKARAARRDFNQKMLALGEALNPARKGDAAD